MIIINNIDGVTFEINGIRYQKNFISVIAGSRVKIVNVYDTKLELAAFTNFADFTVNGNTFLNVETLQQALLPVLFTRSNLNGVIVSGNIIDVTYNNPVLTFVLADTTVINIDLPFVQSVTGTAVDNTDPRNPIINSETLLNAFSLRFFDTAGVDFNFEEMNWVRDAINLSITNLYGGLVTALKGQQLVFYTYFVTPEGAVEYRSYTLNSGEVEVTSITDGYLELTKNGEVTITAASNPALFIELGEVGVTLIETAFNTDINEPFLIEGEKFITALRSGEKFIYYWRGGLGTFGNSATPAIAANFLDLTDTEAPPASSLLPAQTIASATHTLGLSDLNRTTTFTVATVVTIPNTVGVPSLDYKQQAWLSFKSTWTINYPTTDGLSTLAGVAGALVYIERNNIGNEWIVRRVNSFTPNLQQVTDVLPSETNNSVKFKGGITLDTFPGANLQNQLTGANGAGIMLLSFISSGNTIKKIRAILNSGASFDNINFLSLTNSVSDILVLRINGRGVIEAFDATILRIDAANIRTYITKEWFFDKITNAPAEASPDNIITEKAGEIKKTPFGSLFSATAATGGVIDFTLPKIYNSPASPEIGNITDNLTGALIGVVQKVYHNHTVAPAFPIGWVLIGGEYVISSLNIIYCEWVSATRVEYWIAQEI